MVLCLPCSAHNSRSLEENILQAMADYQAIGASVVAVKENKVCYHHTFGYNPDYNDTTLRKPIPDDGIFWLASVSKSFVSTAIMQLMEKNSLELDDDINKYLKFKVRNPNFPETPITVRMLLCHRSSINDKHYGWNLDMMQSEDGKEYVESFNDYKPGAKFAYCNLNYSLLGAVIENVTKMRFDKYINENICKPLGMNASYDLTSIDSTQLVRSLRFDKKKKRFVKDKTVYNYEYIRNKLQDYQLGFSTASFSPSGGMKMSIKDLTTWMLVHMNYGSWKGQRIVSKESELAMWAQQGEDSNQGFGFSHYDRVVKGEIFTGMTGGAHGINSVVFFNPERKFGFVIITNGYAPTTIKGRLPSLARELARILYKHFIK